MSSRNIESIIDKLKAILVEHLSSKLTDLENEHDDGIPLTTPTVCEYTISLPQEDEFITIVGSTTVVNQQQKQWALMTHGIYLTIWVIDTISTERITKRIYRYIRGMYEILAAHLDLDCDGIILNFESINYTPLYETKRETVFMQGASILLRITVDENLI